MRGRDVQSVASGISHSGYQYQYQPVSGDARAAWIRRRGSMIT